MTGSRADSFETASARRTDHADRGAARNFRLLLYGFLVSSIGSVATSVALPLAVVLSALGDPADLALVAAAQGAGSLVASSLAGSIVTRVEPRRLMIALDLARGAAALALGMASGSAHIAIWHLAAFGVWIAALSALFGTAQTVMVPTLVGVQGLVQANARLAGATSVSLFAGPLLAGVVAQRWSPVTAIGVDGLTYLLSAGALAAMGPTRARETPAALPTAAGAAAMLVLRRPDLRGLALASFGSGLFTAMGGGVSMYYRTHDLGMPAALIGLVSSVTTPGYLLGPWAFSRLVRLLGAGGAALISGLAFGIGTSALPVARGGLPAITAILVAGGALADAATPVFHASVTLSLQERAPREQLAHAAGLRQTALALAAFLGPCLAAVAARVVEPRALLWISALGATASALATLPACPRMEAAKESGGTPAQTPFTPT